MMIEWTSYTSAASIQNVCVDHCRSHVVMTQQFLDGPDVVTVFQQVCSKAVTERMTTAISINLR
jgi:hypothetical protein